MRKIAILLLILLGVFEVILPALAAARSNAFGPKMGEAFSFSTASDEQLQVYREFRGAMGEQWRIVSYCGAATIALGVVLLLPRRERRDDA